MNKAVWKVEKIIFFRTFYLVNWVLLEFFFNLISHQRYHCRCYGYCSLRLFVFLLFFDCFPFVLHSGNNSNKLKINGGWLLFTTNGYRSRYLFITCLFIFLYLISTVFLTMKIMFYRYVFRIFIKLFNCLSLKCVLFSINVFELLLIIIYFRFAICNLRQ